MPPAMKRAKKDPTILAQEWQTWSPLANTLLTLWGQGEISAPTVQKIAHAAKLCGCTSQDVQSFASIGAFGKHHQNCHRDLIRKMPQSLVPESLPVTCNVKDSQATSVDVMQVPLKLPCLWMHHLSTELEVAKLAGQKWTHFQDQKLGKVCQLLEVALGVLGLACTAIYASWFAWVLHSSHSWPHDCSTKPCTLVHQNILFKWTDMRGNHRPKWCQRFWFGIRPDAFCWQSAFGWQLLQDSGHSTLTCVAKSPSNWGLQVAGPLMH